jgi:hypothetical protein
VSYFDPEFTTALETNGSLNQRAQALARGLASSTPLSPSVQANFQGFTYVDESALDDHMQDRYGQYDDDDDFDNGRRRNRADDDDWEEVNDVDDRNPNRMSGIVRGGSNDDHMFDTAFEP